MSKFYYRGMAEQNGKPKAGRSARLLGVRPGVDIDIEQSFSGCVDEGGYVRPEAECKYTGETVAIAIKNGKGMSVSLSIEGLPAFRKPAKFGGTGRDPLWQVDDKLMCI